MQGSLAKLIRLELAPPRFLSRPPAGIDVSVSGIKVVSLKETMKGLVLDQFGEEELPEGAIVRGEIMDHDAVIGALSAIRKKYGIQKANITLPEARTYLFDARVSGSDIPEWKTQVEQHLAEYVPLPASEVVFDIVPVETDAEGAHIAGIGVARRIVDLALSVFDDAGIEVESIEGETFAAPRALLPDSTDETVLIIDFGKMTTKLTIATGRTPVFATTLDVGGHAITVAIEKEMGVSEEEARKIKKEFGLVSSEEGKAYADAMLVTVSAIREEISRRLEYWQEEAKNHPFHKPVTRAVLIGGNASLRGFTEYLESTLRIPVELGDVFANLAGRDAWLPDIDYDESLAYATVIGLALRSHLPLTP